MSMSNSRLWDDSSLVPQGQTLPPPRFVSSLVNQLGLARASHDEQSRAIANWLTTHEPTEPLRKNLVKKGYGHLLEEAATKPDRRKPHPGKVYKVNVVGGGSTTRVFKSAVTSSKVRAVKAGKAVAKRARGRAT